MSDHVVPTKYSKRKYVWELRESFYAWCGLLVIDVAIFSHRIVYGVQSRCNFATVRSGLRFSLPAGKDLIIGRKSNPIISTVVV